jgi:GNAT superfamily N-acetyltransferase
MEPVIRVGVVVTFLRMERAPRDPAPALPAGAEVRQERPCSVAMYRYLYDSVGAAYCWWLRRTMADRALAALLRDPAVGVHVLRIGGEVAGFYELDRSPWPLINLSYFGLLPEYIGRRIGSAFLRHAVDTAWREHPLAMTVNTCTADHPRALPGYLRVGFRPVRRVPERWNVPVRLGLSIAPELRL